MTADRKDIQVALIGQPNVGKSALFSRMTGVGVISSNYPGTTVEFEEARILRNDVTVNVHDLPGTYSLSKNALDENAAIQMLADPGNDAVVIVADAMNLPSSIVLCFEILELGLPSILALNKMDIARNKLDIDIEGLSEYLGIPVLPVSAKTSEGVDDLVDAVCAGKARISDFKVNYSKRVEAAAGSLADGIPSNRYRPFGVAVKMLEDSEDFILMAPDEVTENAVKFRQMLEKLNDEPPAQTIGRERYALADTVVKRFIGLSQRTPTPKERFSDLTIEPLTGVPILFAVMGAVFLTIVYLGGFLDEVIPDIYDWLIGDALADYADSLSPLWGAVLTGASESVGEILALMIAYILVFYLILAVLEDSGYLTRVVVLLDSLMHRFGLHGGAVIPIMVGIGCNVPAILATRSVRSRRERIIIASIIVMAVPCSAQLAIIMGITGSYAGIQYSLLIMGILVLLGGTIGLLLNRFLPREPSSLAMELPEMVIPQPRNILTKTWSRMKDFFTIAFPLLVVSSILISVLIEFDMLGWIIDPFSPLTVGLLGLPAATIIAFAVGILRKEMAVGMLAIITVAGGTSLLDVMTPEQFVVFGLVMAVYVPCIATLTVMWKELGWRDTLVISAISIGVAVALGALVRLGLMFV